LRTLQKRERGVKAGEGRQEEGKRVARGKNLFFKKKPVGRLERSE